MAIRPLDLIHGSLGKRITVTLKNGTVYKGLLRGYDEFTNLVLDDVEEISENKGKKKRKTIIFRGTNILFVEGPQIL